MVMDEVIPMIFSDKNGDWEYNGHYPGLLWLENALGAPCPTTIEEPIPFRRYLLTCATGVRLRRKCLPLPWWIQHSSAMVMLTEDLIKVLDTMQLGSARSRRSARQALTEVLQKACLP